MNQTRFDTLTRTFGRRAFSRGMAGAAIVAVLASVHPGALSARKGKKNKKPKVNRFGCRNVGVECANASQCCSGICEGGGKSKNGKRRKKACRAHDTGGCRANLESCTAGRDITCTTATGEDGFCHITTGNGPYCALDGIDSECVRDEDCFDLCGPLAACSVCAEPGQAEFRFCAGPSRCEGFARP